MKMEKIIISGVINFVAEGIAKITNSRNKNMRFCIFVFILACNGCSSLINKNQTIQKFSSFEEEFKEAVTLFNNYDSKSLELAEIYFRNLVSKDSNHSSSLAYLSQTLCDRKLSIIESIVLANKAIEVDPKNYLGYRALASCYFRVASSKRSIGYSNSLFYVKKSIKLNPLDSESAWILYFLEQINTPNIAYDEKNIYLQKAISLTEKNSLRSQIFLARYFHSISRTSDAILVLEETLKKNPNRLDTYFEIASYHYFQNSNLEKPIAYLKKAEDNFTDKCLIYYEYQKYYSKIFDRKDYLYYLKKSFKENKHCLDISLSNYETFHWMNAEEKKEFFNIAKNYVRNSKELIKYKNVILEETKPQLSKLDEYKTQIKELETELENATNEKKSDIYLSMSILTIRFEGNIPSSNKNDTSLENNLSILVDNYIQSSIRYSVNKKQEANIYYNLANVYDYRDKTNVSKYYSKALEIYLSLGKDMDMHNEFIQTIQSLKLDLIQSYEKITINMKNNREKGYYYLNAKKSLNYYYSNSISFQLMLKASEYFEGDDKAETYFMIAEKYFIEDEGYYRKDRKEYFENGIKFLKKAILFEKREFIKEFYKNYLEAKSNHMNEEKNWERLAKEILELKSENKNQSLQNFRNIIKKIRTLPNSHDRQKAYIELMKFNVRTFRLDNHKELNAELVNSFILLANESINLKEKAIYLSLISTIYSEQLSEWNEAIVYLQKAIEVEPDFNVKAELYLKLARLFQFTKPNNKKKELESLNRAISFADKSTTKAEIYLQLAYSTEEKSKYYDLAFQTNPLHGVQGYNNSNYKRYRILNKTYLEGWAGSPENIKEEPFDYFYMEKNARASEKSILKSSGAMMQSTCVDAATTQAKGDLIGRLVGESFLSVSGTTSDGESNGSIIVRNLNRQIKGVNTFSCMPIANEDHLIIGSQWKECSCLIFVKIPGGRDAIFAEVQELDKKTE
ncbi:MAG: hypothetical protein SFU98_02020 [Leptospiraceae bacterium]|nr:hypothetical protein [Leptospiraceae bacterium]